MLFRSKIPVGAEIAEDSPRGAALRQRITDTIYGERFDREYDMQGATLGYRYEGSPIVVPDGTPEPPDESMHYLPTARPGHRAPHAWLADGTSTLDLFGREFTLLRTGPSPAAADSLVAAAKQQGVPLVVRDVGDAAIARLYERRLVLVRPDGHVAWRGDTDPADAAEIGRAHV